MRELIAGRIRAQIKDEDGKDREVLISRILAQLYFDGLQGKVILRQHGKGTTYVSPAIFLKSFQEFMLKDMELRLKEESLPGAAKGHGRPRHPSRAAHWGASGRRTGRRRHRPNLAA